MRYVLGLFAVAASSASALGGFVVSAAETPIGGGVKQVDVFAFNDGADNSGTQLHAFEARYIGTPVSFRFGDIDGNPVTPDRVDFTNATDVLGKSFFRVGTAANTLTIDATNALQVNNVNAEPTDPILATPLADFFVVTTIAVDGAPMPATPSPGALFARFILPETGRFTLSGRIIGEIGPTFSYSVTAPEPGVLGLLAGGVALLRRCR